MIDFKYFTDKKKNVLISPLFILLLTGCSKTEITPIPNQKDMTDILYNNSKGLFDPTPFAFSHSATASGNYLNI